ncbi:uncharacterized protein [Tenebrio molitor]|uniref:uncharacterized protein n=1 Tax=Tenebrio molitor TaxID=7067 RepID=UPI0036248AE3
MCHDTKISFRLFLDFCGFGWSGRPASSTNGWGSLFEHLESSLQTPGDERAGTVPFSSQFQRDGSYIPSGLSGREPQPPAKTSLFTAYSLSELERACPLLEARRAAERVQSPRKSHLQDAVERNPISASSHCCVNHIHQIHDVGKKIRDFPVTDAPRTKTRLFADDTAVWTSQRNPAIAAKILQGHLDKHLENQAKPAQIPVHLNVLLRSQVPPPSPPSPTTTYYNQAIPKLQHIRYLGVTFSKNCTLHQDVKETLKKSRNRANLLYSIRGRIRGCDSKTLYHTYKSYIRPVIEYRAPIYATLYPALLHQISACERRMLRRIFRLPDRFPSDNLHQETNTIPIQSRLKELQSRFVTRTLNCNNALAIQTLSTSFKYPSRDGRRLLNRIPKIPKRKLKHPPTALLSPAYTDLPDDLQELVDSTPLTMR